MVREDEEEEKIIAHPIAPPPLLSPVADDQWNANRLSSSTAIAAESHWTEPDEPARCENFRESLSSAVGALFPMTIFLTALGGAGDGKFTAICGLICFVVVTLHNAGAAVVALAQPEEEQTLDADMLANSYAGRVGLSQKTVEYLRRDVSNARNRELMKAQIAARLMRRSRGSSLQLGSSSSCRVIFNTILSTMTGSIPPLIPWLPHLADTAGHPWDDTSIGIAMSASISALCLLVFSLLSTTWKETIFRFITLAAASGIAYSVGYGCGFMY
eukprot:TRINITY_DN2273_c0_g1_i2.p1 TRINITY_DN2273_c0_g1~~TRINITY_DN2273_c0_g1_i2.p1  ORF type:complete len:272 (+),score=34.36 TRINITY_DN2273_c0_g1_i2:111-926(+)